MSSIKIISSLVTVQWLAENLNADNLVILDASMKPVTPVSSDAPQEEPACIQGARRFDFDDHIHDKNTDLPHMMPSAAFFTEEMQKLGIHKNSAIVVYDYVGIFSSPRAWWMFRAMGHDQVAILDGGLPAWKKAGYPCGTQAETIAPTRGDFIPHPQTGMFVDSAQVLTALSDQLSAWWMPVPRDDSKVRNPSRAPVCKADTCPTPSTFLSQILSLTDSFFRPNH